MISVKVLRASGLSDKQIADVIETAQAAKLEKKAAKREAHRQAQRRYRTKINEQKQQSRDLGDHHINHGPSPSSPPSNGFPSYSPSLTTSPSSPSPKDSCPSANGHDDGFEHFWRAYPRQVGGKKAAKKAYGKALKETSLAVILEALTKQKPRWRDPKFIPYPATWLNRGQWQDEFDMQTRGGVLGVLDRIERENGVDRAPSQNPAFRLPPR